MGDGQVGARLVALYAAIDTEATTPWRTLSRTTMRTGAPGCA